MEGNTYLLTISDEEEALLAAAAAGGAVLGIWREEHPMKNLGAAAYLVEDPSDVTDRLAEQVVRRRLGLPWIIGETERLVIREFCMNDEGRLGEMRESRGEEPASHTLGMKPVWEDGSDRIFLNRDTLEAYIRGQYYFYEYGIWAIVEKQSGTIIGRAGITDLELDQAEPVKEAGYGILAPYRGCGYGMEAMSKILEYGMEELAIRRLYARIDPLNTRSIRLAEKLGFKPVQTDTGSARNWLLYAVNLTAGPDKEASE